MHIVLWAWKKGNRIQVELQHDQMTKCIGPLVWFLSTWEYSSQIPNKCLSFLWRKLLVAHSSPLRTSDVKKFVCDLATSTYQVNYSLLIDFNK